MATAGAVGTSPGNEVLMMLFYYAIAFGIGVAYNIFFL
jgi:hypothetical protein